MDGEHVLRDFIFEWSTFTISVLNAGLYELVSVVRY